MQKNTPLEFILYVADQRKSREFYSKILGIEPVLDVPGMTEFQLNDFCKLGLMPEQGIAKIITPAAKNPASGNGIPRCELYLMTDDPESSFQKALDAGALVISPLAERDWGHLAAYVQDFDGHIIAFAREI
jgi:uncharacterized glyoxalase superfamily protein PhnB